MGDREVQRDIKVHPHGYDQMIAKLKERDKAREQAVYAKYGTSRIEELQAKKLEEIKQKFSTRDHRPVKDTTILTDPQSQEVISQKSELASQIARERMLIQVPRVKPDSSQQGGTQSGG